MHHVPANNHKSMLFTGFTRLLDLFVWATMAVLALLFCHFHSLLLLICKFHTHGSINMFYICWFTWQYLFLVQVPNTSEPAHSPVNAIPTTKDGSIDWSKVRFLLLYFSFVQTNYNKRSLPIEFYDICYETFRFVVLSLSVSLFFHHVFLFSIFSKLIGYAFVLLFLKL